MASGPGRQPYAGVDFIPLSGIYEFGYSTQRLVLALCRCDAAPDMLFTLIRIQIRNSCTLVYVSTAIIKNTKQHSEHLRHRTKLVPVRNYDENPVIGCISYGTGITSANAF
jgi:hypothetical protein